MVMPKDPRHPFVGPSLSSPNPASAPSQMGAGIRGQPFLQEAFAIAQAPVQPDLVFVIMAFQGEGMADVYSTIQDECRKLRLQAKRADEIVGSGFIIKEIGALIEKAEFIICDLTHERPNVYYELGYAHGVGNGAINLLLVAREGTRLHFDIAPLGVRYYPSTETLRALLALNLKEMIRARRSTASALASSSDGGLTPG